MNRKQKENKNKKREVIKRGSNKKRKLWKEKAMERGSSGQEK